MATDPTAHLSRRVARHPAERTSGAHESGSRRRLQGPPAAAVRGDRLTHPGMIQRIWRARASSWASVVAGASITISMVPSRTERPFPCSTIQFWLPRPGTLVIVTPLAADALDAANWADVIGEAKRILVDSIPAGIPLTLRA